MDPFDTPTDNKVIDGFPCPFAVSEFWTSRQRQSNRIHQVSYRACFKPELARYFIERYSAPGDIVYDPFAGRGTTAIESALLDRQVVANDINPLSRQLCEPRLRIPNPDDVADRLNAIPDLPSLRPDIDLSMFYHQRTLTEILSLRAYLVERRLSGVEDIVDGWLRMVATNRLTGHSPGFFSVYTLPPNQAVRPDRQARINRQRGQTPDYRDIRQLIIKKTRQLLSGLTANEIARLKRIGDNARFYCEPADATAAIKTGSVQLTVTSPPFLDVVQYADDNWLRCWFNGIDAQAVESRLTMARTVDDWSRTMANVFRELHRITTDGGVVAFEVGEVRGGRVRLHESVGPIARGAGFHSDGVLINEQTFTKTANVWGVSNDGRGQNTNRGVVMRKR